MLPRAGLGDDALLAHAPGEQDLTDRVVDLVRAGMAEIFALEIDLRAAELLGQPFGEIKRRFSADIFMQIMLELPVENRIAAHLSVSALKLRQRRHESFGYVATAVRTEVAPAVRHLWQQR